MIYNKIVKHILLPLYLARNNDQMLNRLLMLDKSQYLDPQSIRMRQLAGLKRILNHCYDNVPFYRERFDSAGFNPACFSDFSDLSRIPYLTKDDLQKNLHQLVARNFSKEKLILDASGGSTGKPTNFYKDIRRYQEGRADQIRHDRWCGWDLGEKRVMLWGAQREFDTQFSTKYRLVEKYVHRAYGFNAFDISENMVVEYIEMMKSIKPTMIIAYANVAYLFAKIIESHDIDLSHLRLKGLICSAETLTEQKRNSIESAFCCKALNRYGSREVGLIASECLEQDGLHINSDSVYLEVEKGGRATALGEPGEIIVTDLWNYGMPFIRYQMGDVGIKSSQSCNCGRSLPKIKEVQGRVSDFFIDARGGLVHGEYFTHLFYGLEGVEQFQLVQETIDRITLNIIPGRDFAPAILDPVVCKIKQCIGADVTVDIKKSDSSFIEASGKFRFTISKLSNDYFKGGV
jgi:phenylacetate-CoA ligase